MAKISTKAARDIADYYNNCIRSHGPYKVKSVNPITKVEDDNAVFIPIRLLNALVGIKAKDTK